MNPASDYAIRSLTAETARASLSQLSDVLIDCVEGGASVSFMAPLDREKADRFWRQAADAVATGDRVLIVAQDRSTGEIVGTVTVQLALPENQPHRGEIAKMLVKRAARRHGLGAALMGAAEDAARQAGKTVLVLDTVTGGDAERLYERLGWVRVGEIPNFALMPDGRPTATTFFYRDLAGP